MSRSARLQAALHDVDEIVVTASNRAGMVYRLERCRLDAPELAARLDGNDAVDAVMYLDGEDATIRRESQDAPIGDNGALDGYPGGAERIRAALRNPNAGELIVSAAPGFEFADLGGRHHSGGGSHGSLVAGDSEVPLLLVGVDGAPRSIADVASLALAHFGVAGTGGD